jgi:hypothetical protein
MKKLETKPIKPFLSPSTREESLPMMWRYIWKEGGVAFNKEALILNIRAFYLPVKGLLSGG